MAFLNTPNHAHVTPRKTAVLLVNLGTPQAPTARAVRVYLKQFLGDPRVVEIPRLLWLLILHGIILRVRPAKSAKKYASVWTEAGSPLAVHTAAQTEAMRARLQANYPSLIVEYAMNYGQPALKNAVDGLTRVQGVDKLLVFPLFPQFSATTTASIWDAVLACYKKLRNPPELRMVKHYHDDAGYIAALVAQVQAHWVLHPWAENAKKMLIMTFHGLPQRNLMLGDPYFCECHKTARLLGEALGLTAHEMKITFQSRFGKAAWLQPYTEPTFIALASTHARVDVICPGFTGDCLETLEEIAIEGRAAFEQAGGQQFHYIAALNETAPWLDALEALIHQHLQGWQLAPEITSDAVQREQAALALGAQS